MWKEMVLASSEDLLQVLQWETEEDNEKSHTVNYFEVLTPGERTIWMPQLA
jgi:hypothetical protein